MNIDEYTLSISDNEDEILKNLRIETYQKTLMPRMISGHLQGILLKFISHMIKPNYILEIGTFTGYSTLCLCEGLTPDGKIITIEKNDELQFISQKYFKLSEKYKKIQQVFDDAKKIIPKLEYEFDLVFIDGDKREYPEYFDLIFPKVKKNGFILIDNIFWYNKVLEKPLPDDKYTQGVIKLTKKIKENLDIEKVALPIRDGLLLVRKK